MNNNLPEKIIKTIKRQGTEPRPRWHFLLKHSVLWSLATLATLLGGIAVAVIIFIYIDHDENARAYLNESAFVDLLETIPYLWFCVLFILIGITQYAVRHTTSGYRYTTKRILGVVFVSSLLLGAVLNTLEVGERVQDFLAKRVPYYDELISTSKDVWSHSEKGLLGGTVTGVISSKELKLTDFHNKDWLVDIERIDTANSSILREGSMIKMIGTQEDNTSFRAVRVLPWK